MATGSKASPRSGLAGSQASGGDRREWLRQRQAELRRNHVLDAAEEVFGSQGFAGATMREIAAVAGFSPTSVYNQFESKDELFAAIMDRHGSVLLDLHRELISSEGSVTERLHRLIDRKISYHLVHPEFSRLYQRTIGISLLGIESLDSTSYARFHELMEVMATLFREGMENGEFYSGDPTHHTMLFSGMVEGHLARVLFDEPETAAARQAFHDAAARAFVKSEPPRQPAVPTSAQLSGRGT
jgi:AcrR family transcriptional regulator